MYICVMYFSIGSDGVAAFTEALTDSDLITHEEMQQNVPTFPIKDGKGVYCVFGRLGGVSLLIMQGLALSFKESSIEAITFSISVMKELGTEKLILTNAAGGLSPNLEVGDVVLITDHIDRNLGWHYPMPVLELEEHGPWFLPSTNLYSKEMYKKALQVAEDKAIPLKKGVYVFITSSCLTPLEVRWFRIMTERHPYLGPLLRSLKRQVGKGRIHSFLESVVEWWGIEEVVLGMNLVPEVLIANHLGMKVLAINYVTDLCFDNTVHSLFSSSKEVADVVNQKMMPKVLSLVHGVIRGEGDAMDMDIDVDTDYIMKYTFPKRLCISWQRLQVYTLLSLSGSAILISLAACPGLRGFLGSSVRNLSTSRR